MLVVEDQPIMQLFYRKALSATAATCFHVKLAGTVAQGTLAIDKAFRRDAASAGDQAHYAIMDFQLPDGNCLDLLRHARERGYTLRAIVVTGHTNKATMEACAATGLVDAFFTKPVSVWDLQRAVHKHACPSRRQGLSRHLCAVGLMPERPAVAM